MIDKGTNGKRAHAVPLVAEVRELLANRVASICPDPRARLFTDPCGGRITTAVLRGAPYWDEVLRHTGLT